MHNHVYMQDIHVYLIMYTWNIIIYIRCLIMYTCNKFMYTCKIIMQDNYVHIITQYFFTQVKLFSCNWKIYAVMSLQGQCIFYPCFLCTICTKHEIRLSGLQYAVIMAFIKCVSTGPGGIQDKVQSAWKVTQFWSANSAGLWRSISLTITLLHENSLRCNSVHGDRSST